MRKNITRYLSSSSRHHRGSSKSKKDFWDILPIISNIIVTLIIGAIIAFLDSRHNGRMAQLAKDSLNIQKEKNKGDGIRKDKNLELLKEKNRHEVDLKREELHIRQLEIASKFIPMLYEKGARDKEEKTSVVLAALAELEMSKLANAVAAKMPKNKGAIKHLVAEANNPNRTCTERELASEALRKLRKEKTIINSAGQKLEFFSEQIEIKITPRILKDLFQKTHFNLKGEDIILFAFRGALPVDENDIGFTFSKKIRLVEVDYEKPKSVIGIWKVKEKTIAIFQASTVPSKRAIQISINSPAKANQLITGLYRYSKSSFYRIDSPPYATLRPGGEFPKDTHPQPALRTLRDTIFGNEDDKIVYEKVTDLISTNQSRNLNDAINSYGGIVVKGFEDKNNQRKGPWKVFWEELPDMAKNLPFILLDGENLNHLINFPNRYEQLRYGSSGEKVRNLQNVLKLHSDGIFGINTLLALNQNTRNNTSDCKILTSVDAWVARELKLNNWPRQLSQEAIKYLLALFNHENSSKQFYEKRLQFPIIPGGISGITIGFGYDLKFKNEIEFKTDWEGILTDEQIERFLPLLGKSGQSAKHLFPTVRNIKISYNDASYVFYQTTLPRYENLLSKLPNINKLPEQSYVALLSLIFNRGFAFGRTGDRYKEMRAIKTHLVSEDYVKIPNEIRSMKRLWKNKPYLRALLRRRDEEARWFEDGLKNLQNTAQAQFE